MSEIKNYAVVGQDNIVVNVIAYDGISEYNPGEGMTLIQSDTVGIGHIYNGDGTFTNPFQGD